ncbi:hypothetical protein LCGC14_1156530, partial [marine sediment metagenome]
MAILALYYLFDNELRKVSSFNMKLFLFKNLIKKKNENDMKLSKKNKIQLIFITIVFTTALVSIGYSRWDINDDEAGCGNKHSVDASLHINMSFSGSIEDSGVTITADVGSNITMDITLTGFGVASAYGRAAWTFFRANNSDGFDIAPAALDTNYGGVDGGVVTDWVSGNLHYHAAYDNLASDPITKSFTITVPSTVRSSELHVYGLGVIDGGGRGGTPLFTLTVITSAPADTTPPTITLDSVTPNPSNGITVITASNTTEALDSNGMLANVSIPGGGYIYPTMTYQGSNEWTGSFDVSSYSDGTFTVNVNGSDAAGNTGDAGPVSITGDSTKPTIVLDSVIPNPSNGITVITASNTTEALDVSGIMANVSLPGGGYIFPTMTFQGGSTWNGTFDVSSYSEGTFRVGVNGTDLGGNIGFAGPTNITGDLTAPAITLTVTPDPSNGITTIQAFNTTEIVTTMLANVSTPSGYIYPTLTYQGSNEWSGSFDVNSYGEGIYTINVNGTDLAGNIKYVSPVSITGDLTPPTITLTVTPDPSNGITTIQAFNTTEVVSTMLANVSTPSGYIYPTLTYQGSNEWSGSFDVSSYGEGTYTISVNGTDIPGNVGYATPVNISGDLTAPTITLTVTPDPSNGITTIQAFNTTEVVSAMLANVSTPSGYIYPTLTYQGSNEWSGSFDINSYGDGTYTISMNGTDLATNVGYATPVDIIGDITAPTITLTVTPDPSNGITTIQVFNTTEVISGSLLANVSTPSGYIYPTLTYQGSNEWSGSFDVNSYGDGTYTISVNGTDLAGNVQYNSTSIFGDITLPSVAITSPTEGENVGGSISIIGTASGTGSNIASIYINNSIWGDAFNNPQIDTATGNPTGSFTSNNKSYIAPGNYWVEINITDYAGNFNSTVRFFIVSVGDSTPPNIIITVSADPSNGFTNITVTTNEDLDAGGPPLLNITLPDTSVVYRQLYLIASNTWQTNYTVVTDGTHIIAVNATDIALNIGTATKTFEGDLTAPTITLTVTPDPSNGITTIQAFNTTEVVSTMFANVSTPSGYIYPTLTYQGSNEWSGSFDVSSYGEGTYTISVNGTDIAGNVGYATPVIIIGDLTAPTIALTVTPDFSNGITTIQAFNTTEVVSAMFANISTPSGYIYPTLTYQGSNEWSGSFDVSSYGDGTYTISVNGTDIAGNFGYATPVIITGDLTAPTITLTVTPDPSNGITTIQAFNTTEVISGSLLVNVSTPSGYIYPTLTYQGSNEWSGSFDVSSYGEGTYTISVNGT